MTTSTQRPDLNTRCATTAIARQPILDAKRHVFGYELFDRSLENKPYSAASDAALLFNLLSNADSEMRNTTKTIFINCTHQTLAAGHLELIEPDRIVLEIPPLPADQSAPFILLAAACYAKASPKLHARLLNHRWFGPMLRDWERDRSMTQRTKTVAVGSMTLMVALSIWGFQGRPLLQGLLLTLGIIGAFVVLRIPTRR